MPIRRETMSLIQVSFGIIELIGNGKRRLRRLCGRGVPALSRTADRFWATQIYHGGRNSEQL